MKTWITSDHHFHHSNVLNFVDDAGRKIRPEFASVEEMNEYMIAMWNEHIAPDDKVYHLGDIIISTATYRIDDIMNKLNGRKILIRGNHDIAPIHKYAKHFNDIRGSHGLRDNEGNNYILSHYPIHPSSLRQNAYNIHGHTHQRCLPDNRYINICVETTNYLPIDFNNILEFHN